MNNLQFEKYIKGCLITWNHGKLEHELVNISYGIIGEMIEFRQTLEKESRGRQVDEAGDLLYYTTVMLYKLNSCEPENDSNSSVLSETASDIYDAYLNIDFFPFFTENSEDTKFHITLRYLGYIAEHMKKFTFHGKELDYHLLSESTLQILMWLFYTLIVHEITIEEVIAHNFDKLSKRYPDGFKKLKEQI